MAEVCEVSETEIDQWVFIQGGERKNSGPPTEMEKSALTNVSIIYDTNVLQILPNRLLHICR